MKQKWFLAAILGAMFFTIISVVFLLYNAALTARTGQELEVRLQEIVAPNIVSFELQMQEQIKKVNTFADFLAANGTLGSSQHISLLQSAVKNNGLLRCAIAFPNGSFVTHDSKNAGNVSTDAFFVANMQGRFFITDPRPAVVDPTKTVILFAAPIQKNGQILGSVIYSYLCNDMDRIFNLNFMQGQGRMVVINQAGTQLIGHSDFADTQENLLESLRSKCLHKNHDSKTCLVIGDKSIQTTLMLKGMKSPLRLRCDRLPFNDWFIVSMIPEDVGLKEFAYVNQIYRNMGIVIFCCLLLYAGILFFMWRLQNQNIDKMTGALTMTGFKKKVLTILRNNKNQNYIMVQLDISNFKLINRIHGFTIGDSVIKNIVAALNKILNETDTAFARIGIDVFIMLLPYHDAHLLNEQRKLFTSIFHENLGDSFSATVKFPTGHYVLTEADCKKPNISDIIEKVNFAHKAAKYSYGTIVDYKDTIEKSALLVKTIEDRMNKALNSEEFALYLQPKYSLPEEHICGAEALVRWKVNGDYFMYPTDFIPVFERNGFIVHLDKYIFEQAAKKLRNLADKGFPMLQVSVNFSRHHLNNEHFVEELCQIADKYKIPHSYLEIEITESALFEQVDKMADLIKRLHKNGFSVSMDDFGSGYSCLAQLIDLYVDILKIDKGFFAKEADIKRTKVVVSNMMKMAHELGITTVAEGVETKDQLDMLSGMNCDMVQGFYFCKPLPSSEFDKLLLNQK